MVDMEYKYYKDFLPSVRELWKSGGPHQRAAATVQAVIGRISTGEPDPFVGIPLTNHGESRIDKCVKYDLNGFCRLITVTDDGICCLLFAGSHKRCDRWIENQRGFVPRGTRGVSLWTPAGRRSPLTRTRTRISGESGHSYGKLYEALGDEQFDQLVDGLPRVIVRRLEGLESIHSKQDIERVVVQIVDANHRAAVYDVFSLLRQNNVRAAIRRVGIHVGHLTPLPEVDPSERGELIDSDTLKRIPADSPQFVHLFEHYVQTADYRDWMLFTHPDQERVAEARFAGPAKLTGVSGSGKTAIVVKRALILAERYPEGQILILTLNRPLAKLIEDLVQNCGLPGTCARISVLPFFGLCQRLLHEFEPDNDRFSRFSSWREAVQHCHAALSN
jgi:UvrD-like helicase family protein